MRIDLSKKITKYAKKILVMFLVIHICILSSGSFVRADQTINVKDKIDSLEKRTPSDEEVKEYIEDLMKEFDGYAPGQKPEWDQVLNNPEYDITAPNEGNIGMNKVNERAALYLIDLYKKTGSEELKVSSPDFYDWLDLATAIAQNVDSTSSDVTYGSTTYEEVEFPDWKGLLNNSKTTIEENKAKIDEEKNGEENLGEADNGILKVLDGIAGVLFIGFKIVPIIIGGAIELIMNVSSGEQITIYNLLFNEVGLTNINFFERASRK